MPRGPAELRCGAAGRDLDVGVLRGRDAAGGGHVQREVTYKARHKGGSQVWFITALAYHFCLALLAAFTQPRDHLLAEPCI